MSLRNNVVVALAIVILAGQGCFDIGPLGLFDPNGSEECCSGGGGPNPLVLQSLYFGRSADTIVSETSIPSGFMPSAITASFIVPLAWKS